MQPPHEEGLPDRRAVLPRRSTDEERTQLDAVWREEFRRFRTEDAEVRRENALLRKEDIKLRLQNTELRRALVRQTGHPDTVEVGDGGVEEDLEQSVQFTSRTVWAIAIGGGIVLVLCIAFWACEEYIRNAADQDGDGDVDMEDRKIAMRKLRVNATSLLAGFTLTAVVVGVFVILCWTGVLKVMLAQLLMYALLMVCVMGCLGIFMYNIYMNLVNLLGSLFGDLKDMITGVVEYLEEKAEEAAEEVEKVTGTMGFMSQDSPGMYVIKSKCDLQKTEKLDSQILQMLNEGVLVNVMKVRLRLKESRIRGLVESPRGWISLQDLESGFRWADKKEYRKGKFKVIVDSLPVSEGVEVDSPVASKPVVKRGDIVKVSQVRHRIREGAVRGAIDEGWITLLDTKTGIGVRNVQPIETQPTEGLFPFFTGAGESSSAAEVSADTAMLPGDAAMAAEPAAAEEHREPGEEEQEDESRMHDLFTDPFLTKRTAPAA